MDFWSQLAIALVGATAGGIVFPRHGWFRTASLPEGIPVRYLEGTGPFQIAVAHMNFGRRSAVIIAHGLMKSMRNPGILAAARRIAQYYDVILFDFPGHGLSGGTCQADFKACAEELKRVVAFARNVGYFRIGIVGYSMGAAAGIIAAAQGTPIDALVSVSCPAAYRAPASRSYKTWWYRWWAQLMGTRLSTVLRPGPWPTEYVAAVAPVPLYVVHHGWDTLVTRQASEKLYALAKAPKDFLYVPKALHAWPTASIEKVCAWLLKQMPLEGDTVKRRNDAREPSCIDHRGYWRARTTRNAHSIDNSSIVGSDSPPTRAPGKTQKLAEPAPRARVGHGDGFDRS